MTGKPLSMVRRLVGYGAGSVIAATTSELAFLVAYGPLGAGPALSSAAGFVGGAVPNYFLNRRWAWSDRRGRDRRTEVVLYVVVALASYGASVVVTRAAEHWARHVASDRGSRVLFVGGTYLAVSGVFFVVKFVLYHFTVFTASPPDVPAVTASTGDAERSDVTASPGDAERSRRPSTAPPTRS